MVDPETIQSRLAHLEELLGELEQIREAGEASYTADFRTRRALQHNLQLSIQTCIDIASHLIAEQGLALPGEYRGVFPTLVKVGLEEALAERLADAAAMRNVLVHEYLAVDDQRVWGALESLEDLRAFAVFASVSLD